MKKIGDHMEYIGSCNSKGHVIHTEQHLDKGIYIIACKMNWHENQTEKPVCLAAYGPNKVEFEKENRKIAPLFKKFMI